MSKKYSTATTKSSPSFGHVACDVSLRVVAVSASAGIPLFDYIWQDRLKDGHVWKTQKGEENSDVARVHPDTERVCNLVRAFMQFANTINQNTVERVIFSNPELDSEAAICKRNSGQTNQSNDRGLGLVMAKNDLLIVGVFHDRNNNTTDDFLRKYACNVLDAFNRNHGNEIQSMLGMLLKINKQKDMSMPFEDVIPQFSGFTQVLKKMLC